MWLLNSLFKNKTTISYAITVCDESVELKLLLDHLIGLIDNNDEILIIQDITNEDLEISKIINSYGNKLKHIKAKLNGDFSQFKNNILDIAKCKYVFQIDADEIPNTYLIQNLKTFLLKNNGDCFLIPRINIVDGITTNDLNLWGWKKNELGYINYPDYQMRLFKNQKRKIYWKNKVHEELVGFKNLIPLPIENYKYCLIHRKNIEKQKIQNEFYEKL